MSAPMITRSQRRMEKRQALLLLGLVIAVALVSFVLGIMVGRSGAPMVSGKQVPSRLPVAAAPAITDTASPSEPGKKQENLTFYETLSQGETPPLGSGINLPPQKKTTPASDAPAPAPAATAAAPAKRPDPAAGGAFMVQAASFREAESARTLQDKLSDKGYVASVQEVDLGPKGVWYRVLAGTYVTADEARQVVDALQKEFRLAAMVRRR